MRKAREERRSAMVSIKEVAGRLAEVKGDEVEALCIVVVSKKKEAAFAALSGVSDLMIDDNAVRLADELIRLLDEDMCVARKLALSARGRGELRVSRTNKEMVEMGKRKGADGGEQQICSFEVKVSDEVREMFRAINA